MGRPVMLRQESRLTNKGVSKYAFPNFWAFLSFVISHSSESFALNLTDLGQGTWIWPVGTPKVDIGSLQTTRRWFGNVTTKFLVKTGDFGFFFKKATIMARMFLQCQDMVRTCYRSKFGLGLPYISAFESQVLSWDITEIYGKRLFFTKTGISLF